MIVTLIVILMTEIKTQLTDTVDISNVTQWIDNNGTRVRRVRTRSSESNREREKKR